MREKIKFSDPERKEPISSVGQIGGRPLQAATTFTDALPTLMWYHLTNLSQAGIAACAFPSGIAALIEMESVRSFLRNRCTLSVECADKGNIIYYINPT